MKVFKYVLFTMAGLILITFAIITLLTLYTALYELTDMKTSSMIASIMISLATAIFNIIIVGTLILGKVGERKK